MIKIPITKRARDYGYVFWKMALDPAMKALLGDRKVVEVVFLNGVHGKKNIDWRYRRISVGWRWTRTIPESKKFFVLTIDGDRLDIQCR